jgi:hypothetical protein
VDIPWAQLQDVGPWGLVTLAVWSVFTGRLVPGKERDYWRKAFFAEQDMRRELEVTGTLQRKVLTALSPPDGDDS